MEVGAIFGGRYRVICCPLLCSAGRQAASLSDARRVEMRVCKHGYRENVISLVNSRRFVDGNHSGEKQFRYIVSFVRADRRKDRPTASTRYLPRTTKFSMRGE